MRQLPSRTAAFTNATRRQFKPHRPRCEATPLRLLELECRASLADWTESRESRLLQASNERFECLSQVDDAGELARLIAFEVCYLALAATLRREDTADGLHPSIDLVALSTTRLALLDEDASVATHLTKVYRCNGWETLDLEAIVEWCNRVRGAVVRYLQVGGHA